MARTIRRITYRRLRIGFTTLQCSRNEATLWGQQQHHLRIDWTEMRTLRNNSKLRSNSRKSCPTSKSQVGRKKVVRASFQNYRLLKSHRKETYLMTVRFSMMQRQRSLWSNRLKPHLIVILKNCNCQKSRKKLVISRKGICNRDSSAKARLKKLRLLLMSRSSHQDRISYRRSSSKPT